MSRIKRLVRPESEPLNWKLALPILGLVACAAFYTYTAPARAATDKPTVHRQHSLDDGYALVRDGDHGTNMSGDSDHWAEINAIKPQVQGEFLWFREGGKSYIVQDRDILSRAEAAWAPVDQLGKQMDAYGQQMDVHGKKMEALGKQIEASVAKTVPDQKSSREFERKMNALGREMDKLGARFEHADDAERDRIGRQMDELGRQMGELGRKFGQQQQAEGRKLAQASVDEVSRQMHELSAPMDELGGKMGALGKEMERESMAADKTVRQLIREAQSKGLARPAPAAASKG